MGLYSEVVNHCPILGEDMVGQLLQTKSLDCLCMYWIAPDGAMFHVLKYGPHPRLRAMRHYDVMCLTSTDLKVVYVLVIAGRVNRLLGVDDSRRSP